jgi:hypothetical protein
MEETGEIQRPTKKFSKERDMAPIEHILIGSGIPIRGKIFNFEEFANEFRSHNITDEAYIPKGIEFPISDEERNSLQWRRENQKELIGMMAFLDEQQFELGNYMPYLRLTGLVDDERGEIDPVWQLSLVGRFEVKGNDVDVKRKLLDKLVLQPQFSEFFNLDKIEGEDYLALSLKEN